MDLVWNVYRHRSIKLDMIESDGNVDVGKTSAKMFHFDTNILSVYFSFKNVKGQRLVYRKQFFRNEFVTLLSDL